VTNLAFYGRLSMRPASPAGNALGAFVVLIPVLGGLVVGLMARFGSIGILTRSDLLSAHLRRLEETHALRRGLDLFRRPRSA
jgi:hypothetical protein